MRAIDLAHPPGPEKPEDFVRTEPRSDGEGHAWTILPTAGAIRK
jgi:hypothetical protein